MMETEARIDLHVHSRHSRRPSQWVLKKLGCPESFTEPVHLYRLARKRGMTHVTITDHNSITGALEIAHLPDTFVSEEVTTYFPEDQCKVHVLVHDIDEATHDDIQAIRENVYDLTAYLRQRDICHVLAHPLYSVNDRLTVEHFEKLLLLFRNFELNGARDAEQNHALRIILSSLTPRLMSELTDRHGLEPAFTEPWRKNLTAGSDDHSSLTIAGAYTRIEGAQTVQELLAAVEDHRAEPMGKASTPQTLAHNLYGIAYQFYRNRMGLDRYISREPFLRFLDRFLQSNREEESFLSRITLMWSHRKRPRNKPSMSRNVLELLKAETQALIQKDPELMSIVESRDTDLRHLEKKWFRFVNQLSNRSLLHFSNHLLDHLSGANVLNIFQSLGSAGGLYTLLAPYFVSFSIFSSQRRFSREALHRFTGGQGSEIAPSRIKVAHFTDTFYEVNGVARTLQQQVRMALRTNKNLTVITCGAERQHPCSAVHNFRPIGVYELPEYPEQKLHFPPFLEMLNTCYEEGFTHIHSATPGPIGIAALAIARILKLPFYGTYHTALPQYAQYLTNDTAIEDLVWKYTIWYYDQMDLIFVPSNSTAAELVQKGISPRKIQLFPRGIDIQRFHPSKRNGFLQDRYGIRSEARLLYVGRISREKNLQHLERVFHQLTQTHPGAHLVLVGDGPYLGEMRERMKGLPCTFTGYLEGEDLASVYASSDLFLFPSTTDTFGNVVLEAQASGIPVVVTNLGGPRENLIPGETGLIVDHGDPEAFLSAIRALLDDPVRMKRMGQAARRYMEDRSFESAFNETWRLYRPENREAGSSLGWAV
ncbi:MAG: glycosyltransferase [Syntrophobacteraceae bacterium]|nr:glycosyltransferase [Syntrophobacteraceae bacterium]